jgi:hypothetical protein
MLTGKNKERFEQFYADKFQQGNFYRLSWFYGLPLSMQFGVYVDYADSIGYDVNVAQHSGAFMFLMTNDTLDIWEEGFDYKTREEAIKAAIKAFDEIVNG